MTRAGLISGIGVALGLASASWAAPGEWRLASRGFDEGRVSAVAAASGQPSLLYAAAGSAVYVSRDGGQEWQVSFRAPAQVNDLAVDPAQAERVLAATDQGLYGSFDGGTAWSLVLRGAAEGQDETTVVEFHPQRPGMALLGTRGGLFMSEDGGQRWREVGAPQEARDVAAVAQDPADADRLWVVSSGGLFVGSLSTGQWQQRFGAVHAPEGTDETASETEEVEEREDTGERLTAVARDPTSAAAYLATSRGVYVSLDTGATWQRLEQSGLLSTSVSRLLLAANSTTALYAGTERGLARYEAARQQWQTLTEGPAASRVNDVAVTASGGIATTASGGTAATASALWVATDEGLYRADLSQAPAAAAEPAPNASARLLAHFSGEPTVTQVQQVAIRYAEVHPEKIALWRKQARLRALVPTFSAGVGNNVTDKWHWEGGSTTLAYDDRILRGKQSLEWDTTLAWDLGDMIYSADQTSIDVRSKLMVQLRDDIVDEVTRTYFERRRVQLALLANPPSDPEKRMEKELRVEELTALIDGLTGGWFSQQLAHGGADGRTP